MLPLKAKVTRAAILLTKFKTLAFAEALRKLKPKILIRPKIKES